MRLRVPFAPATQTSVLQQAMPSFTISTCAHSGRKSSGVVGFRHSPTRIAKHDLGRCVAFFTRNSRTIQRVKIRRQRTILEDWSTALRLSA